MADYRLVEAIRKGAGEWTKARASTESIDLRGANLQAADLQFTDLRGLDLLGANFAEARVRVADFSESNLTGVSFRRATIAASSFDNADLTNSNFAEAQIVSSGGRDIDRGFVRFKSAFLKGASFVGASITDADFSDASFSDVVFDAAALTNVLFDGADFRNAHFKDTHFYGLDFSSTLNLESAGHAGPSLLGFDSIRMSGGSIPVRFLRGCGLSEVEITMTGLCQENLSADRVTQILYEIMDTYGSKPIQLRSLFISYSHLDRRFVDAICVLLDANGVRYWRDNHNLKAGRLEVQIARGINLNPTVLIVLSEHSCASDWVEWEVSEARELERKLGRDVLCPIALDDKWRSSKWPGALRRQIEAYNVLDFSRWEDPAAFDIQWLKLLGGLTLYYT
jgi:uncharacterized protein YjbI with pentapeptide repeats